MNPRQSRHGKLNLPGVPDLRSTCGVQVTSVLIVESLRSLRFGKEMGTLPQVREEQHVVAELILSLGEMQASKLYMGRTAWCS